MKEDSNKVVDFFLFKMDTKKGLQAAVVYAFCVFVIIFVIKIIKLSIKGKKLIK